MSKRVLEGVFEKINETEKRLWLDAMSSGLAERHAQGMANDLRRWLKEAQDRGEKDEDVRVFYAISKAIANVHAAAAINGRINRRLIALMLKWHPELNQEKLAQELKELTIED